MINACIRKTLLKLLRSWNSVKRKMQKLYLQMAARGINSVVPPAPAGCLTAVSAILGVRRKSSFEGEASTTLQFRAEEYEKHLRSGGTDPVREMEPWLRELQNSAADASRNEKPEESRFYLPTDRLVRMLVELKMSGEDVRSWRISSIWPGGTDPGGMP